MGGSAQPDFVLGVTNNKMYWCYLSNTYGLQPCDGHYKKNSGEHS